MSTETHENLIKAVATGEIRIGGVSIDCYVLADERRVLSASGIQRGIGGAKGAGLGRYLRRLPSRFEHLAAVPKIEFAPPGGGRTVHGYDVAFLKAVCQAYVDASIRGELREDQRHMAIACAAILSAAAEVGLVALVDEATGYQGLRPKNDLVRLYERILRHEAARWEARWGQALIRALCRLYGHPYDGGRIPQWLASPMATIYETVLGADVMTEMRRRNPEPRFGSNHHQYLHEPTQALLAGDLAAVELLASQSGSPDEFWRRVRAHYRNEPLQLGVATAIGAPSDPSGSVVRRQTSRARESATRRPFGRTAQEHHVESSDRPARVPRRALSEHCGERAEVGT